MAKQSRIFRLDNNILDQLQAITGENYTSIIETGLSLYIDKLGDKIKEYTRLKSEIIKHVEIMNFSELTDVEQKILSCYQAFLKECKKHGI